MELDAEARLRLATYRDDLRLLTELTNMLVESGQSAGEIQGLRTDIAAGVEADVIEIRERLAP